MSTPLTIVARIEAKNDRIALVRAELLKLIAPTRAEAGFLQYDVHQDNTNPAVFLLYENWTSRELWQAHMASLHLAAYMNATEGAVASSTMYEMSLIGN